MEFGSSGVVVAGRLKVSVVEHVTYNDDRVIRWSKWVEEGSAMRETKEESIK